MEKHIKVINSYNGKEIEVENLSEKEAITVKAFIIVCNN